MNLNDHQIKQMFNKIKNFSDFIENNPNLPLKNGDNYHLHFDKFQTFISYFLILPQAYRENFIKEFSISERLENFDIYLLILGIKVLTWITKTFGIFEFYELFSINFRDLPYSKFCKQENVISTLPIHKQRNIFNYYLKRIPIKIDYS